MEWSVRRRKSLFVPAQPIFLLKDEFVNWTESQEVADWLYESGWAHSCFFPTFIHIETNACYLIFACWLHCFALTFCYLMWFCVNCVGLPNISSSFWSVPNDAVTWLWITSRSNEAIKLKLPYSSFPLYVNDNANALYLCCWPLQCNSLHSVSYDDDEFSSCAASSSLLPLS